MKNNFKDILLDLIDENGTSISELSKLLDIDDSNLYDYKNHGAIPNVDFANRLANYFGCSLDYLFGLDENFKEVKPAKVEPTLFFPRYLRLLEENKISHYKFCKNASVNTSSLWLWKKGSLPKMETLIKIATYFGVSIDYLVGRSDD